jgi:tRNA (adenine37-N6)-methyltransferase
LDDIFKLCYLSIAVYIIYTNSMEIKIRPVGTVRNEMKKAHRLEAADAISHIIVAPRYGRALDGIEDFSHIVILFWLDRVKAAERSILKVHPRKDPSLPLTGVFATRSPARPNPVGLTTVKLIRKEANVLTVKGLDAIDGTPVLDIKPYIPESFQQSEIVIPQWVSNRTQGST